MYMKETKHILNRVDTFKLWLCTSFHLVTRIPKITCIHGVTRIYFWTDGGDLLHMLDKIESYSANNFYLGDKKYTVLYLWGHETRGYRQKSSFKSLIVKKKRKKRNKRKRKRKKEGKEKKGWRKELIICKCSFFRAHSEVKHRPN